MGSMMLEDSALFKGLEILDAEDFYRPVHQDIFTILADMAKRDVPVDQLSLNEELRRRGKLEDIGGAAYLFALVDSVLTASNIEYYAKTVKDKATLRRLITAGTKIAGLGRNEEAEVDALVDEAQNTMLSLQKTKYDNSKPVGSIVSAALEDIKAESTGMKQRGIPFGLYLLDHWSYGVEKTAQIFVIAARPSIGKTALALKLARNAASTGRRVVVYSYETSELALTKRMIIQQAQVDGHALRTSSWGSDEEELDTWSKLNRAEEQISSWKDYIIIDDNPGSITDLVSKTKRHIMQHPVDAVIIDYFQIIPLGSKWDNPDTKLTIVGEQLKQLTQTTKVPIVLLAQINRAAEKREDKRPNMGDIRGGGNIEAAIDKLLILHRTSKIGETPVTLDFILDKNKDGPTGEFGGHFIKEYYDFRELSMLEEYGDPVNPYNR